MIHVFLDFTHPVSTVLAGRRNMKVPFDSEPAHSGGQGSQYCYHREL